MTTWGSAAEKRSRGFTLFIGSMRSRVHYILQTNAADYSSTMQGLFVSLLSLILLTTLTSSQDASLFSTTDLAALDQIDLNISDDAFPSDTDDDFPLDDDPFLVNEIQFPNDLDVDVTDPNLLAADDHALSCSALTVSSSPARNRARSDACPPQGPQETPLTYLDVTTDENVKKYWCSKQDPVAFGNIPVCLLPKGYALPSSMTPWRDIEFVLPPLGYETVFKGRLSKFYPLTRLRVQRSLGVEVFDTDE